MYTVFLAHQGNEIPLYRTETMQDAIAFARQLRPETCIVLVRDAAGVEVSRDSFTARLAAWTPGKDAWR